MANINKLIPVPEHINPDLDGTKNSTMLTLLGNPRSEYDQQCREVTNTKLKRRMVLRSIGPFRVTGFDLAVASLKQIFKDIKAEQRQVYDALSSAGMLCCRRVRGSTSAISNHSWGTAIDMRVNNVLDKRGNDKVQVGLSVIAPIFNRHKWFWGAGFTTEDAMHFEVSEQLMQEWRVAGKLENNIIHTPPGTVRLGDRGNDVVKLQEALNRHGETLTADGVFGPNTYAALVAFQSVNELFPDGICGRMTWAKLEG